MVFDETGEGPFQQTGLIRELVLNFYL
jgi:hypothetical protein